MYKEQECKTFDVVPVVFYRTRFHSTSLS